MIDDLKRLQVQVLHAAGLSKRRIAREAGTSQRSVQRIVEEKPVVSADDPRQGLRVVRGAGRSSAVAPFRRAIEEILKEKPSLLSVERNPQRTGASASEVLATQSSVAVGGTWAPTIA